MGLYLAACGGNPNPGATTPTDHSLVEVVTAPPLSRPSRDGFPETLVLTNPPNISAISSSTSRMMSGFSKTLMVPAPAPSWKLARPTLSSVSLSRKATTMRSLGRMNSGLTPDSTAPLARSSYARPFRSRTSAASALLFTFPSTSRASLFTLPTWTAFPSDTPT